MAERKRNEGKALKQSAIVEKLVSDPGQVPDIKMLTGFLGKSVQEGYWRLYTTVELDAWIEFAEEDVVLAETLEADASKAMFETATVWLKRGATLRYTQTVSTERQAEFLRGDITSQFLSGSSFQGGELELAWTRTIIRTASRLLCTKVLCSQVCTGLCPVTGPTTCVTCLNCNKA